MQKAIRVLADGCFDPIHEGHVAYLEAAASFGTELVVNTASDAEIWQKRPLIGPLLPLESRKAVLGSLKPVARVVCMDTKEALETIRPDIYIKGADWRGRLPVEETEICRRLGIEVQFVDTVMNSSGQLLQKFVSRFQSKSE